MLCDIIEQATWSTSRNTISVLGVIPSEILPLLPESWKLVSYVGNIMRDTKKQMNSCAS